jgi:predicted adenine nucleotide alpha hydrolase (AANH) superfamily ATPase
MRLLLHICCAPCALMPVQDLRQEGVDLMGLFYNPNIQPYSENRRRRETLQSWAQAEELRLIVQDEYDPQTWLRAVAFRESERCRICLHQRLTRAASVARQGKFDAFGTTLLYSRHQPHQLIAQTGQAVAAQQGVEFFYRDYRPQWRQGQELARQLGLYRQPYCGCIYSERDRYLGGAASARPIPSAGER